jgi:hypothetical protein
MTDGTDTGAASAPAAPPAASSAPAARQGAIADNTYQRLSQADQARYAQVRAGPDGGSEWVDRSTLPSATDAPSTAPADPGKPADPNARHRFGDTEFSEQEMRDFLTARADAELRKTNLPASPENYEAKLPDGFKAPEGIDIKIDTTAPEYLDAAKWAHAKGLGQQEFSEMLSLHASLLARQEAAIDTARRVEVAKLGANGTARVTSLETWLRGMVGDEIAGQSAVSWPPNGSSAAMRCFNRNSPARASPPSRNRIASPDRPTTAASPMRRTGQCRPAKS